MKDRLCSSGEAETEGSWDWEWHKTDVEIAAGWKGFHTQIGWRGGCWGKKHPLINVSVSYIIVYSD